MLLPLATGLLGLLVGSFLNVVVWRVPRGESVVHPASACPACGRPVRPWDNVPVLSWLLLRGRCRDCGEAISRRYPLVEAATGLLFALVAAGVGLSPALPAFLYLTAIGVALALIDLDVHRLPDAVVLPSYPVAVVLLGTASLLAGDPGQLLRMLLGGLALFACYFLLAFIHPSGMGFGDVKLAGVLGLYLGWAGWGVLVVGGFLAFLLGGVVGVAVLLSRRGGRRTRIPFGPFMLLGAAGGLAAGNTVVAWYLGLVGL